MAENFTIRYLPLFEQDLAAVSDYIEYVLLNPAAARRLVENTEIAIQNRLANPLAFEPYHSAKERKYPYYRIYIKNYVVLYVVIGNVMEVRRFLYNKRDMLKLI